MIIYDSNGTAILGVASNRAEDHYNLGVHNHNQGKINEAIANYIEALRLNPDLPEAHVNLATAYYSQGKVFEAIKEYKEALKINPDFIEAYCNMGNAYCDLGEYKNAILCYRAFVEQSPSQYSSQVNQVVQMIIELERLV